MIEPVFWKEYKKRFTDWLSLELEFCKAKEVRLEYDYRSSVYGDGWKTEEPPAQI